MFMGGWNKSGRNPVCNMIKCAGIMKNREETVQNWEESWAREDEFSELLVTLHNNFISLLEIPSNIIDSSVTPL